MDVSITLKGKHNGNSLEVIAINCTVVEERQTFNYPGSLDISYESIEYNIEDSLLELEQEYKDLYDDEICNQIYEAWHDREPY